MLKHSKRILALLGATAAVMVTMVVLLVNDPAASIGASFQGLGFLPMKGPWSHAFGVSGDGQVVVGSSETGASFVCEAFRWTEATGMVGLGYVPGGDNSLALDTSADGSVVVGWARSPRGQEAFRWTAATGIVGLGDLRSSDFWSTGFGVSADGSVVVGEAHSPSGPEAFRWTQATGMVGLGDLPGGSFYSFATHVSADGLVVVGFSDSGSEQEAFRWTSQAGMVGLGDLPGGRFFSRAQGVSPDGSVVVGLATSAAGYEAFRWTQATGMVGLGDLPGGTFFSEARAASAHGSVVVGSANYSPSFGATAAFIWDAAHGMRSLRDVLVNEYDLEAPLAGWTLDTAEGVSADGKTIVGVGINPDGQYEAWVAVLNGVPAADAGPDQTVECTGQLTEVQLDGRNSSDPDGDPITFEWSAPDAVLLDDPHSPTPSGLFPCGPSQVTLTVTDGQGGMDIDDVVITVQDTTPPVVVCTTDKIALWPADHRMVDVNVYVQASDVCAGPDDLLLSCTVSSSEPDDGNGDGQLTGDVDGQDAYATPVPIDLQYDPQLHCFVGTVSLRAERDGSEAGRVYSIACDVLDGDCNLSTASCVVVVPHDRRKK